MSNESVARAVVVLPPADVTLVESPACHFCADAEDVIVELSGEFDLHVRRVPTQSVEGMELMQEFGAAMSPLVLLDGEYVTAGRLSRGKVRKMLETRLARLEGSQR